MESCLVKLHFNERKDSIASVLQLIWSATFKKHKTPLGGSFRTEFDLNYNPEHNILQLWNLVII